jgi:hypothetical protein
MWWKGNRSEKNKQKNKADKSGIVRRLHFCLAQNIITLENLYIL